MTRLSRTGRLRRGAFLRDAGALTAGNIAVAVITIAQGVLLARWLGPRGYGVVALVSAYPALVRTLLTPESLHATVRFLADREALGDREGALAVCKVAYLVDFAVGFVGLILVAASAPWAADHVLQGEAALWLLVLMAGALCLSAPADAATATLMHTRRFGMLASGRVIGAGVRGGLMVVLVAGGGGPTSAVVGAAAGSLLHAATLTAMAALEGRKRWGGWWPSADIAVLGSVRGEMLRFMAWTDLGSLLGTALTQLDILLLGWLVGITEAGYYRLAGSIAGLPGHLVGSLQSAAYPRFSSIWAERPSAMSSEVLRHVKLGVAAAIGGLACVFVIPSAVRVSAGTDFSPAVPMAQLLYLGSLIWLGFYWLKPLYMAAGEARRWVWISAAVVTITVALFIPSMLWWGGIGLASVRLASAAGNHLVALYFVPVDLSPGATPPEVATELEPPLC